MQRKEPFAVSEIYHIFVGGVDKRDIFMFEADYQRFVALLLFCNSGKPLRVANLSAKFKGTSLVETLEFVMPEYSHADVLAYALMPGHAHLVLREKREGGISAFMHKLMTSYSMYFNRKYERSGPLFVRPFRSKHIADDEHIRWLFAYIHLVPLTLAKPDRKKGKLDQRSAQRFMREYQFSSFHDFLYGERSQSVVLSKSAWPIDVGRFRVLDDFYKAFTDFHPEQRGGSLL